MYRSVLSALRAPFPAIASMTPASNANCKPRPSSPGEGNRADAPYPLRQRLDVSGTPICFKKVALRGLHGWVANRCAATTAHQPDPLQNERFSPSIIHRTAVG